MKDSRNLSGDKHDETQNRWEKRITNAIRIYLFEMSKGGDKMQIATVREDENEADIKKEITIVRDKLKAFFILEHGKIIEYFHNPQSTVTYELIKYKGKLYTAENRNLREWEESRDKIIAITTVHSSRKHFDEVKEKYRIL